MLHRDVLVHVRRCRREQFEAVVRCLGLQTRHQTVKGLYVVEGPAAALVVVALELGKIKVLIERLQLGQSLLQRLRRVGEPGEVAEPIRIDYVSHLHHIGPRSREVRARVNEIPGEEHGGAATRVTVHSAVIGRRRRRAGCVAHAVVRSHISHHATAQPVLRKAQMMAVVMRDFRFHLNLVDVREQARRGRKDVEVAEHVVLQIQVVVPLPFATESVIPRVVGQPAFKVVQTVMSMQVNLSTNVAAFIPASAET